jgi:rhodanese-related sulfurtransferase
MIVVVPIKLTNKDGFVNVKVLGGGVDAWKNTGYPLQT